MKYLRHRHDKEGATGEHHDRDGVLLDIQTRTDEGKDVVVKLIRNDEGQMELTTLVDGEEKVRVIADGPIGKLVAKALTELELEDILDEDAVAEVSEALSSRDVMPRIKMMREIHNGRDDREVTATIVKDVHSYRHGARQGHDDGFNPEILGLIIPLGLFLLVGFIVYFSVKSRRDQRMAIISQGPEAIKHLSEEPRPPRDSRRQGLLYTGISLGLVVVGVIDYLQDINNVAYLIGGLLGAGVGLLIYDRGRRSDSDNR